MGIGAKQHIFFVDDEERIRRVAADVLGQLDCKVSCFESAKDCLELLGKQDCDLLITDVKMPEMDGLALLNKVRSIAPWVPVMIITGYGDIPMAVSALKSGAVDFVEKPLDRNTFLHKVKSVLQEGRFAGSARGHVLTKMEKKVLKLILDGKGNKEIAFKLGCSLRTVEVHRSHIMHKFNVDNVVDLVKKAGAISLQSSK